MKFAVASLIAEDQIMLETFPPFTAMVQRTNGRCLAISPDSEPLKIGAIADTYDDAARLLIERIEAWHREKAEYDMSAS